MGKSLRTDCYRIVQRADKQVKTFQVKLYDHQKDPEENENITAQHPEIVEKLLAKLS